MTSKLNKQRELKDAVIVSAVRTPVAKAKGAFAPLRAEQLGAVAFQAAVERCNLDPALIDHSIFSNVNNLDLKCPGKYISLDLGYPVGISSYNVEHGCGSSLTAAALCNMLIEVGNIGVGVAGGVEHSSTAVYLMDRPTQAYGMNPPKWCNIKTTPKEYENLNMGETAERIAKTYGITREECDEFSLLSHQRAAKAWAEHRFDEQIAPVSVPRKKGAPVTYDKDDIFRPDCNIETLSKLRPSFSKEGIVTAGNSSPFCDGASAVILAEKELARANGLNAMGRIVDYTAVGVQPQIMGIGPAVASKKLLSRLGMTLDDIDLIEMNEAFASQSLACIKEMNFDYEKLNVNGGAIALGHPFAATGGILITKMLYELKRRNKEYGLVCFCIGGGQGVSMILQRF